MNKILIGIDPDVDFNGVAMIRNKELSIQKLKFFELMNMLKSDFFTTADDLCVVREPMKVYIEAGWLNKISNYHVSGKGESVSARIGTKVGANHQVGKLIAEMCEYLGIEYELVQPRTSKYTIKQFRMMSGYKGKLDQDMVDSALLILNRV